MLNLPRRKSELEVELHVEDDNRIVAYMSPLADSEFMDLVGRGIKVTKNEEGTEISEFKMPVEMMDGIFSGHLLRIEGGIQIEGEDFDVGNPEHLICLPQMWRVTCVAEVVSYSMTLPKDMGKGSSPQVEQPHEDGIPAEV